MIIDARQVSIAAGTLALGLVVALPSVSVATPGLSERADSTFRLVPREGHVKVSVRLKLTNQKAPTARIGPCAPGSPQRCRITTSYYWTEWGLVFVPTGSTKVSFSGPGVRATVEKKTRHWTSYKLSFPRLNYRQSKDIRISYLLGGKPRSKHRTRVLEAYSYFCWHGEPSDTGTVKVILPRGYEATTYFEKARTRQSKKQTTITANRKTKPAKIFGCTDAVKPAALIRAEVPAPGGGVVVVEGWPEDPEWSDVTVASVTEALPALEELTGRRMPLDELLLREVPKRSLYGYGSSFGVRLGVVRLGDHNDDPGSAARVVSSAWFNSRRIKDEWLRQGLSNWAGDSVVGSGCWLVSDFPGKGAPKLRVWKSLRQRPTEAQEAVVDWQYEAACNVVQRIASRIGADRMRDVIASILDGGPVYARDPNDPNASREKRRQATWKDWLDAADELGLAPAGERDLMYAQQPLIDHGIASAKELKGRSSARADYHAALAAMDGVLMPPAVTRPMDAWRFRDARAMIPVATNAYDAIMSNSSMSDEDRLEFLARFEAAKSKKGLRSIASEARAFEPAPVDPPTDVAQTAGS